MNNAPPPLRTVTDVPPEVPTAVNSPAKSTFNDPPMSEFEVLHAELKAKPLNPEGWKRLVALAETNGDMAQVRTAYDGLLEVYPKTSSAQVAYINHFMNDAAGFGEMKDLFQRFLVKTSSVELCRFYMTYVRRTNTDPATRSEVSQAYELALKLVGQDKDSGDIWADYIRFLESGETRSTWEQQQKMDSLRRVYQRAVQIPLENVQKLWEEYESFENALNRTLAKKFMADLSPSFIQARQVLRELRNHLHPLWPQSSSSASSTDIILPHVPSFDAAERALVGKWKAYLKWEESNPLLLEDKDKAALTARIQMAYRKAVTRMRFYPEIWFLYYTWLSSVSTKPDDALSILQSARDANPASYLLAFAYAETQELKQNNAGVHDTFNTLLNALRTGLDTLQEEVTKANSANSSFSNGNGINDEVKTQPDLPEPSPRAAGLKAELDERRKEFSLVWIMYMRFSRRAEGENPSRTVFKAARRETLITWEVYEAAAFMEYNRTDNLTIPVRIFDMGLDRFATEVDYVLRYLGWLLSIKDEKNARVLFERVIGTFAPEKARPLWERWARYEYQYGDLQAAHKLEKRMAEVYPSDPPLKRFAQRQMYLGIDAIADRDLGFALARRAHREGSSITQPPTSTATTTNAAAPLQASASMKRAASPDHGGNHRGRKEPMHKKARQNSPPPSSAPPPPSSASNNNNNNGNNNNNRDWSRDRPPPSAAGRRRPSSPRRGPPPQHGGGGGSGGGGGGGNAIAPDQRPPPPVIVNFLGRLPSARQFDGPVFKTDDLMKLFVGAQITSARPRQTPPLSGPPPSLAPPASRIGRPPPDYSPYRGPAQPPARW